MKDEINQRGSNFAVVQRSSMKERLPRIVWNSIRHTNHGYKFPNAPNLYYAGPADNRGNSSSLSFPNVPSSVRIPLLRAVERQRCLMNLTHASESISNAACVYEMTEQLGDRQVKVYTELNLGGVRSFTQIKGAERLSIKSQDVRQINIVTGICLFGRQALHFVTDFGVSSLTELQSRGGHPKIREIRTSQTLSLYEMESAIRLTGMIDNILRVLPSHIPVTVTFDVPRVDYYLYLMEAWGRSLISRELMLEWFRLVDDRNASVISLLHRTLCASSRARVSVRSSSALDELECCVRSNVVGGRTPELCSLMAILEKSDRLWSMILSEKRPLDFIELAHISYVVEELRASLSEGRTQLGIFVENPNETRILDAATKVAKSLRRNYQGLEFPMLGIYPLEYMLLFDDGRASRSSLYHYDQDTTKVVDASGDIIDLLDVVESFALKN